MIWTFSAIVLLHQFAGLLVAIGFYLSQDPRRQIPCSLLLFERQEPAWNGISFKSKPGLCASQALILPGGTYQQCIVVKDAEEM